MFFPVGRAPKQDNFGRSDSFRAAHLVLFSHGEKGGTASQNYGLRWKQAAARYENLKVLASGQDGVAIVLYQAQRSSWIIPGRESPFFSSLAKHPLFPMPSAFPSRFTVYRSAYPFPVRFTASIRFAENGGEAKNCTKQCKVYLHGFSDAVKLHDHIRRHVLEKMDEWSQDMRLAVPDNIRQEFADYRCGESCAECDMSRYSRVHSTLLQQVIKKYYEEAVTFFARSRSITVHTSAWDERDFKILSHNREPDRKKYRILVFNGTCLDMEEETPHIHLAIASMYHKKARTPPFSLRVKKYFPFLLGSLENVQRYRQ